MRTSVESARCGLYQSGFEHRNWNHAVTSTTRLMNFVLVDPITNDTAWERRFHEPFNGLIVPFGDKVDL